MLSHSTRVFFGSLLCALPLPSAHAASLQASPVLVEMRPGAPSSTITVRNTGSTPIDVQTRVMRWRQSDGRESLEETSDIVTSPPMLKLQPGVSYSIRVVRTGNRPIPREEAFRVLVDQLPDPTTQQGGTVALVVRHAIPLFVMPATSNGPQMSWSVGSRNGKLVLRAQNAGDRRVRLSAATLTLSDGRKVSFGNGLLGYVHPGASMEWLSPGPVSGAIAGAKINVTTELGPLEAQATAAR